MEVAKEQNIAYDSNRISAKSYIHDGLVAMWDGIENFGYGIHDPTSMVWKDLVGGIGDMHFFISNTKVPSLEPMSNDGKCYCSDKIHFCAAPDNDAILPDLFQNEFTLEIFRKHKSDVPHEQQQLLAHTGSYYMTDYASIFYVTFGRKCSIGNQPERVKTLTTGGTSSVIQTKNATQLHFNSENINEVTTDILAYSYDARGDMFGNGVMSFKAFCNQVGNTMAQDSAQIGSIRIYSRALTQLEIATNYIIDKERYTI